MVMAIGFSLSLGVKGTIGDALTFQKRGQRTIVREKPVPKDPYSLAQAYQRWDYRDYAHLWTLESEASKQTYRTRASRYHLTGFSLWMREHLRDLPHLRARWHLDELTGAVAYDTSHNANNATIFGAVPAPGLIDGAYYFDGIDDYLDCGSDPTITFTTTFFAEFYIKPLDGANYGTLLQEPGSDIGLLIRETGAIINFRLGGVNDWVAVSPIDLWDGLWHHLFFFWDDSITNNNMRIYIDGSLTHQQTKHGTIPAPTHNLRIGIRQVLGALPYKGTIDSPALYSETLPPSIILEHSERRYPL